MFTPRPRVSSQTTHTYRLWSFDEDLAPSQLELVLVHVDRAEQVQNPLTFVARPPGPRLPGQNGVPEDQVDVSTCRAPGTLLTWVPHL